MLQYLYLVFAFLILGTVAVAVVDVDRRNQSKECTFTKSKPFSCIYFVMKEDLAHEFAADYCFDQFNGALAPIYYSYDEAIEVMKRYYWWAYSKMDVPRLRFGMFNQRKTIFTYTWYNPLNNNEKAVDMVIWRRSFPEFPNSQKVIQLDTAMYDETFTYREPHSQRKVVETYEYMALKPTTMKWSRVNYNDTLPFICEVPRFPKAYCEEGWWLHMKSRSCFYLNIEEKSFTDAAMACRAIGSNLASINDETERNMTIQMIEQEENDHVKTWFGLRHDATKVSRDQLQGLDKKGPEFAKIFAEKIGYNVDGTPVSTYTDFDIRQPDGMDANTRENCFLIEELRTRGGKWNDYNCDTTSAWSLCRKMASTQPYSN